MDSSLLFDYIPEILLPYLAGTDEPWTLLDKIVKIIEEIAERGGYTELEKGIYIGEETKIDSRAVIKGPALIGNRCEVRPGAYLREDVIICDHCIIGNSTEIKKSILFEHVQAPHFNYIGDSILGNYAHLGAAVILSNVRLDKKPVRIRLPDGSPIPTGLEKFGAIIGDGAEIGCQCLLNPGTVLEKNLAFYPKSIIGGYNARGNLIIRKE
jgi:NDP-sugar pyrophosphorylase family protein